MSKQERETVNQAQLMALALVRAIVSGEEPELTAFADSVAVYPFLEYLASMSAQLLLDLPHEYREDYLAERLVSLANGDLLPPLPEDPNFEPKTID